MVDFTDCVEEFNTYLGSEKKKTIIYENKRYLLKFPDPVREKGKTISYINNAISEYIGSNVFKIIGIEVQNTILGKYVYKGNEKIVCACEDFTDNDNILCEFERLALSFNLDKKIESDLEDIADVLAEMTLIDHEEVKRKFWDMFIVDALIGNTDRHNGNWGFFINVEQNKMAFSPIYDCGSCLNPLLEDNEIASIGGELNNLIVNCYSCIKEMGKKINYMTYIRNDENEDCNEALKRIVPKIDLEKIDELIDGIECISVVRKEFYKKLLTNRYVILKEVYEQMN